MTAEGGCISPYRDFDVRSDRRVKAVSPCYHLNITTVALFSSSLSTKNREEYHQTIME